MYQIGTHQQSNNHSRQMLFRNWKHREPEKGLVKRMQVAVSES